MIGERQSLDKYKMILQLDIGLRCIAVKFV
jgi:hypothetical protein